MKQVYPFGAINGEYLPAAQMFLQIEKWLRSENAKQKEHGEIESVLMKDGMELLRLLFQGFLDQQSKEEVMEREIVCSLGLINPSCLVKGLKILGCLHHQ
ncbi:MAG: hypothetical protein H7835_20695, partial [Magnetococcus sp. XQGC-1]